MSTCWPRLNTWPINCKLEIFLLNIGKIFGILFFLVLKWIIKKTSWFNKFGKQGFVYTLFVKTNRFRLFTDNFGKKTTFRKITIFRSFPGIDFHCQLISKSMCDNKCSQCNSICTIQNITFNLYSLCLFFAIYFKRVIKFFQNFFMFYFLYPMILYKKISIKQLFSILLIFK